LNHDHNNQVRRYGRCQTCAEAPQREADRKAVNPDHVIDTRHVAAFPAQPPCLICRIRGDGDCWVCEDHEDRPWEGSGSADACTCGGAGVPCPNGCPFFSDDPTLGIAGFLAVPTAPFDPCPCSHPDHKETDSHGHDHPRRRR
jgi:hypothetical protein